MGGQTESGAKPRPRFPKFPKFGPNFSVSFRRDACTTPTAARAELAGPIELKPTPPTNSASLQGDALPRPLPGWASAKEISDRERWLLMHEASYLQLSPTVAAP